MTNVDPAYWFLDGTVCPTGYSSGNLVEPLIDGATYFDHLQQRLDLMTGDDYLHLTGWRASPDTTLSPPNGATFLDQLRALSGRGARVRALLWHPVGAFAGLDLGHAGENITFARGLAAAGAEAVLDRRLPRFSSHHQKSIVLSSAGEDWAYVGGTDVCRDRFDTRAHDSPSVRQKDKYDAWHDLQCVVRGPIVANVWANFQQRWNDRSVPHRWSRGPGGSPPTTLVDGEPAVDVASRPGHHVQLLRTLARGVYPFEIGGERTVLHGLVHAIDRAQHYVYIEDQYLWPSPIVDSLARAAARGVSVIVVLAKSFRFRALAPYHDHMRRTALDSIRRRATGEVRTFHLQQLAGDAEIYVHSKVMIIDDRYAAIGSANINRRSLGQDSELQLAIVDGDVAEGSINGAVVSVARFAKDLRLALWKEHLGLADTEEIDDPIVGLRAWPSCGNQGGDAHCESRTGHAWCHHVRRQRPPLPTVMRRLIDPPIV